MGRQHTVSSTPGPARARPAARSTGRCSLTSISLPRAVVGTAEASPADGRGRRAVQGVGRRPRLVARHARVAGCLRHQVEAGAGDQQRVVEIVDEAYRQAAGERQPLSMAQLGIDHIARRCGRAHAPEGPTGPGRAIAARRSSHDSEETVVGPPAARQCVGAGYISGQVSFIGWGEDGSGVALHRGTPLQQGANGRAGVVRLDAADDGPAPGSGRNAPIPEGRTRHRPRVIPVRGRPGGRGGPGRDVEDLQAFIICRR